MRTAASNGKAMSPKWVAAKKVNYEWLLVLVASVLGFGIVIALVALAELATLNHN